MVTCSACGVQASTAVTDGDPAVVAGDPAAAQSGAGGADVPLGWMVEHDRARGRTYVCPACVRRHARSIEAKLEQAWW